MNLQQATHSRPSANGFGRKRVERTGKTNPGKLTNAGVLSGSKCGGFGSPSRERLVYLTSCLIGQHVEVQVKDGSVFSGIFHATNAERDFGIILKMARSIRNGSSQGQSASDSVSKAPSKTLIIPAKEFVQIVAKGVSVTKDTETNELQQIKQQDIMLDSSISQSRHVEAERELERWVPDEDDSRLPELENIFDGPWNRGWDQFEANEALFGVKSTFDEELYTTKLERGPQMRELEKEASRIAREIEGEETQDLHLAEERGIHTLEDFEIDEETRFSSVFRGVDDSGYNDNEDILSDSCNVETFGDDSIPVVSSSFADMNSGKSDVGAQVLSCSSSTEEIQCSHSTGKDLYHLESDDHARKLSSELLPKNFTALESEIRIQENQSSEQLPGNSYTPENSEKQILPEEVQLSKTEDSQSSLLTNKNDPDKGALSPDATVYAPVHVSSSKCLEKSTPSNEPLEDARSVRTQVATHSSTSRGRPATPTSSASDSGGVASASSGPRLSPSSSVGSLSSEKSTLNPHAKEFKLNPNAKSFIPSQTPLRPASPVSDGSFYFPTNAAAVPHVHGMPVGIGIAPSFAGHQQVLFNPQAAPMQSPHAYFHPNGPQYGQQMILGHPRQVLYMPTYPPETPYKGRDF